MHSSVMASFPKEVDLSPLVLLFHKPTGRIVLPKRPQERRLYIT